MKEVGDHVFLDSDSWSFKTNKIKADGSFFSYSHDLVRGFDVFTFKGLKDRTAPPLNPRDVAPRGSDEGSRMPAPLAVLLPSLLAAGLIRRRDRTRSADA